MKGVLTKILVFSLYIIPIVGFVIPESQELKYIFATMLSIPGLIYIYKENTFKSISYIGNWKSSIKFEIFFVISCSILMILLRRLDILPAAQSTELMLDISEFQIYILYALVMAPVQELIFRGLMFFHVDKFFKKSSFSIFLTSFVFGLSHIWYPSLTIVFCTFLLGLVWGFSRYKYNSLVGPVIGHSFIGVLAFILEII
ncbi:MAG: CPBP family intramembrane glutamic endopeptidase [Patescibacteria group bacterium]